MFGDVLTKIALLEGSLPPLPRGSTFTLVLATHEVLDGPRGEAGGDASSGNSRVGGGGTRGGGSVTDAGTRWSRVSYADPEAVLFRRAAEPRSADSSGHSASTAAAAASASSVGGLTPRPQSLLLKSVRAGVMGLDVRLQRMEWKAAQRS